MTKEELILITNSIYNPIGYKRKKNNWIKKEIEISKILQLEISQFNSYRFYINYGFTINSLSLNGLKKHILGNINIGENETKRVNDLLLLDNEIPRYERENEITLYLERIKIYLESIITEEDLYNELDKRPNLNDVPLIVKNYFKIC